MSSGQSMTIESTKKRRWEWFVFGSCAPYERKKEDGARLEGFFEL
jgi:hypothetical protein